MKQFLSWLAKRVLTAFTMALLFVASVLGIVYATISWPNTPSGEISGGMFQTYFNAILVDTGSSTLGIVKKSQTTEQIGDIGTAGKTCVSDGTKINCTSAAPTGTVFGNMVWNVTDVGPVTYVESVTYCNTLAPAGTWRVPSMTEMDYAITLGMVLPSGKWFWSSSPNSTYPLYNNAHEQVSGWDSCYRTYNNSCHGNGGTPMYILCAKNL